MALTDIRYIVIADYPNSQQKIGDIVNYTGNGIVPVSVEDADRMKHIYRKLGWWEHQTIETLLKELKFVELIEKPANGSYFLIGDKNSVGGIKINISKGKPEIKVLMGDTDHWYEAKYLLPADCKKLQ